MSKIVMVLALVAMTTGCSVLGVEPVRVSELEWLNSDIEQRQRINNINDHINHGSPLMF